MRHFLNLNLELIGKKRNVEPVLSEQQLSQDLAKLLISEEFTDVKFEIEGKILKAHRNILTSRSEYFRSMLCENLRQDRFAKPIHIDNISFEGFKGLLHFLYTDSILDNDSPNIACELARISDWYNLKELKEKVFSFIQTKLSIDNVLTYYVNAIKFEPKLGNVEELCLKFMAKNFTQLLDRAEFKKLPQDYLIRITQFYAKFH